MRATPFESAAQADAVADAVLVRRLTNAGLSLIAPWLIVLALSGWSTPFIPGDWIFAAAIAITAAALGFASWAALPGDRKTWREAYAKAHQADQST